jgi:hypothetical protein
MSLCVVALLVHRTTLKSFLAVQADRQSPGSSLGLGTMGPERQGDAQPFLSPRLEEGSLKPSLNKTPGGLEVLLKT